ncbi:MAG: thrombospondin type 3 repeat-containing protein [Halioglobus sp.]|nr:thrombospondin type 3 repeat-containing protein [Halioglobus sp.]
MGEQDFITRARGTASHGYYYRTPANQFPGSPRPEGDGCGFEGSYAANASEFARTADCIDPAPTICPFEPDAVVVMTESPVEILVTNSRGQSVQTLNGRVVIQDLDIGIQSMAFPHADGTFAWTLVLPEDNYEVVLTGTASGPYKLTLITYDEQGEPVRNVIQGSTEAGQVDTFEVSVNATPDIDEDGVVDIEDNCPGISNADQSDIEGDGVGDACDSCPSDFNADQLDSDDDGIGDACDPTPNGDPVPGGIDGNGTVDSGAGDGGGGGGGSLGLPTLLALVMLSLWLRRREMQSRAGRNS